VWVLFIPDIDVCKLVAVVVVVFFPV